MGGDAKSGGKVAADFEKIIQEARDRKRNEALAAKIFGKDRRASTPTKTAPGAGSLASRAGVKKQRSVSANRPRRSTGNADGEWTHDLHAAPARAPQASGSGAGSLASRITDPNAPPTGPAGNRQRQKRRAAQVAQALIRSELQQSANAATNGPAIAAATGNGRTAPAAAPAGPATAFNKGMTIRGLAGPFVVMAQNFAPGTTAADIESAMTPVGGIITSCRLVKQHPIVIAEIVFESREGAENVIATFNNQTADGRVLSVYPKVGNTPSVPTRPPLGRPDNDVVVDGSWGFEDPMETDNYRYNGTGRQPPTGPAAGVGAPAAATAAGGSGLYSDSLVGTNRWGRGLRGRAGR
ncbi:hypothetical protein VTK56DRAFT_8476 [Thermocarpiscus australiensis]